MNKPLGKILVELCTYSSDPVERFIQAMLIPLDNLFRPDALADYRVGPQHVRFWLEWDRGTMNVRDLSIKCTAYEHFVTSREWVGEDARVPRLVCVVPDIAQEKRVRRISHTKLAHISGLVVCTCSSTSTGHVLLSGCWGHKGAIKED